MLTGRTHRYPFPRPKLTLVLPGSHCSVSPTRHVVRPQRWDRWHHSQALPTAQQLFFQAMIRCPHVYLPSLAGPVPQASVAGLLLCAVQMLSWLPRQGLFLRPSDLVRLSPDCASSRVPSASDDISCHSLSKCPSPSVHSHVVQKPENGDHLS